MKVYLSIQVLGHAQNDIVLRKFARPVHVLRAGLAPLVHINVLAQAQAC